MGVKYPLDQDFFKTWTNEMAYVLGYFYADGGLENSPSMRGKYVRFSSTDKELLDHVKKLLGSGHKLNRRHIAGTKPSYLLRIGDQTLYNDLTMLGLYPNKSRTVSFPTFSNKYLQHFVRGYFDGDGCVHLERQRLQNGSLSIKRLHTSFTCGSDLFLTSLASLLQEQVGIVSKLYQNGSAYQLRYSTASSVKLFVFMYKNATPHTILRRKIEVFRTFFTERKSWIDLDIQTILGHRTDGQVAKR